MEKKIKEEKAENKKPEIVITRSGRNEFGNYS